MFAILCTNHNAKISTRQWEVLKIDRWPSFRHSALMERRHKKLKIRWEDAPDPDPEVLLKAIRMIMNLPPYGTATLAARPESQDARAGQQELPF